MNIDKKVKSVHKKYKSLKTDKQRAEFILKTMRSIPEFDFNPLKSIHVMGDKLEWGWFNTIVEIKKSVFNLIKKELVKEREYDGQWFYFWSLKDTE